MKLLPDAKLIFLNNISTINKLAGLQANSGETVFPTLSNAGLSPWLRAFRFCQSFYFVLLGKCLFVPEEALLHSLPPCCSLCGYGFSLATGLPFLSLYFVLLGMCLFEPVEALLHSLPPCCSLCGYGFQGVRVNAHGLQILLADVFVAHVQPVSGALSLHKFFVQEILRDPAIFYSDYMFEPAQASLLQQCEHAEDFNSLQDGVVGDFVLPGNVQDTSEIAHAESIQFSLLPGVKSPRLAAVKKCAQDTGSVGLDLCMLCQFIVGPYSLCQPGHGDTALPMRLFSSESRKRVS